MILSDSCLWVHHCKVHVTESSNESIEKALVSAALMLVTIVAAVCCIFSSYISSTSVELFRERSSMKEAFLDTAMIQKAGECHR